MSSGQLANNLEKFLLLSPGDDHTLTSPHLTITVEPNHLGFDFIRCLNDVTTIVI